MGEKRRFTKNKYILIVTIFTSFIISGLIVSQTEFKESNITEMFKSENSINSEFLDLQSIDNIKNFTCEFPIFGYKLIAKDLNPIDEDDNGILKMTQNKLNFLDIAIKIEAGYFSYKDIPVFGKVLVDLKGNLLYIYTIEDNLQGFFMELYISEQRTLLDLAFDGGYCQLIYSGIVASGYSFIDPVFTKFLNVKFINDFVKMNFNPIDEQIETLKYSQTHNVEIYKRNTQEQTILGTIIITYYGIVHECVYVSTVNLPGDLPDDYWEPYTEIDIGIYRREPSEATMKSDLQYYNKKYYSYPSGDFKYVDAYAVYAHGNAELNTAWFIRSYKHWIFWPFWYEWINEFLYPSEVEALWYHYSPYPEVQTDVYPTRMILLATVCEGYSGDDGIPHMAKAFVDYGAVAFIGAPKPCSIPTLHNDEFTGAFWRELCQNDETVYTATISYINSHNQYHDYPGDLNVNWIYDTHIKIYGDLYGTLRN